MKMVQKYKSNALTRVCFVIKSTQLLFNLSHCTVHSFDIQYIRDLHVGELTQLFHTIEGQILFMSHDT